MPSHPTSTFPHPWALELTRKTFNHNVEPAGYRKIGDKTGFLAAIYRVELDRTETQEISKTKADNDVEIPKSVVLKIAAGYQPEEGCLWDSASEDVFCSESFVATMHRKEVLFYDFAMSCGSVDLPIPKCYLALDSDQKDGEKLLIFEDLSEGTAQQCMVEGLSLPQLQNYVMGLVRFNAFSIANVEKWKGRNFSSGVWEYVTTFFPLIVPTAKSIHKQFPKEYAVDLAVIEKLNSNLALWEEEFQPERNAFYPVVVNGDMWTYNLMFGQDQNGKAGTKIVAFLDWQWCCEGSVTQDIARLLSNSVTTELRRAQTIPILKLYYETLETALKEKGVKSVPFSFDEVLKWYRRSAKVAALLSILDVTQAGVTYARSLPDGERKAADLIRRHAAFFEDAVEEKY